MQDNQDKQSNADWVNEELLNDLQKLYNEQDWYYNYSDDHSVWKRGEVKRMQIQAAINACQVAGLDKEVKEILSKIS